MSNIELNEKQIILVERAIKESCFRLGYRSAINPYVCVDGKSRVFNLVWEMLDSSSYDSKRFNLLIETVKLKDGKILVYFTILAHDKLTHEELFNIFGIFQGDHYVEVELRIKNHICSTFSLSDKEDHKDLYLLDILK